MGQVRQMQDVVDQDPARTFHPKSLDIEVRQMQDVVDQDPGVLLAEIAQLKAALAEERAENEALRAETERLYRICEDEWWISQVMAKKCKLLDGDEKLVCIAYRKLWPILTKNAYGLAETQATEIAEMTGIPRERVLTILTRLAKLGLLNKPKPKRERVINEHTGKPIINEKTGKPYFTSRSFSGPKPLFDDVENWNAQPELLRAHGGKRTKKPVPTCPTCGEPAVKGHGLVHCRKGHEWEADIEFKAPVQKSHDDISDEDAELADIIDEVEPEPEPEPEPEEVPSEMSSCYSIEDREPQVAISEPALEELRRYAQGVCWRHSAIDLATGKRKKIPLNPKTGGQASVTAPDTWGTLDEALALKARARLVDGIGFVFTDSDPFIGIDLDGCIDENGNVSDQAADILRNISSYTEYSPSHTGLHIIAKGELPAAIKTSKVEMYSTGRYFTMTFEQLPGTPGAIEARQEQITALYHEIAPPPAPVIPAQACASIATADDKELLARANHDEKFSVLWNNDSAVWGQWYRKEDGSPDYSSADLALVRKLDFYTKRDVPRIDALFRQSGLYREKWDSRRGTKTYGQLTIEKAMEDTPVHTKLPPETAQARRVAVTL
jgi:putative DNA primase/helicase